MRGWELQNTISLYKKKSQGEEGGKKSKVNLKKKQKNKPKYTSDFYRERRQWNYENVLRKTSDICWKRRGHPGNSAMTSLLPMLEEKVLIEKCKTWFCLETDDILQLLFLDPHSLFVIKTTGDSSTSISAVLSQQRVLVCCWIRLTLHFFGSSPFICG